MPLNVIQDENAMKKYFTSESVTEGHPNKVYDQIPDAAFR